MDIQKLNQTNELTKEKQELEVVNKFLFKKKIIEYIFQKFLTFFMLTLLVKIF